jgi:hypothetical protein
LNVAPIPTSIFAAFSHLFPEVFAPIWCRGARSRSEERQHCDRRIMIDNPPTQPSGKRPLGRRLALAGVLTAAVLAGGAGVAYATGTAGTGLVESGYATVVDEGPQTRGTADGDRSDCPERGAGGGAGGGSSETPSEAPSEAPSQTPEQAPSPEGDI